MFREEEREKKKEKSCLKRKLSLFIAVGVANIAMLGKNSVSCSGIPAFAGSQTAVQLTRL